jgi:hypothetical protein
VSPRRAAIRAEDARRRLISRPSSLSHIGVTSGSGVHSGRDGGARCRAAISATSLLTLRRFSKRVSGGSMAGLAPDQGLGAGRGPAGRVRHRAGSLPAGIWACAIRDRSAGRSESVLSQAAAGIMSRQRVPGETHRDEADIFR